MTIPHDTQASGQGFQWSFSPLLRAGGFLSCGRSKIRQLVQFCNLVPFKRRSAHIPPSPSSLPVISERRGIGRSQIRQQRRAVPGGFHIPAWPAQMIRGPACHVVRAKGICPCALPPVSSFSPPALPFPAVSPARLRTSAMQSGPAKSPSRSGNRPRAGRRLLPPMARQAGA